MFLKILLSNGVESDFVLVDGRGCLNKRPLPHAGQLLAEVRPAASVECIGPPWNVSVTLITPCPSLSLLVTLIA